MLSHLKVKKKNIKNLSGNAELNGKQTQVIAGGTESVTSWRTVVIPNNETGTLHKA